MLCGDDHGIQKMDPMLLVFFGGILISLCLGSDVFPFPRGHFLGSISKYVLEVYIVVQFFVDNI